MQTVDSWVWEFVDRHQARHPRTDWPVDEVFWNGFRSALVHHGVTETVAEAASVAMMESPSPFPDQFTSAFVAAVKGVWASSQVIEKGLADRDAAVASMRALFGGRDCDDCHGQGFAVRYRLASLGGRDARGRPLGDAVIFYCLCPLGRWVERCHREGKDDAKSIRRRLPDLADFPGLHGDDCRYPADLAFAPRFAPADLRRLVDSTRLNPSSIARAPIDRRDPAFVEVTPDQRAAADAERQRQQERLRRAPREPEPPAF